MKCPLTLKADFYTGPGVVVHGGDCLKEECAWWNSELEACAIVALVIDIGSLAEILATLGEKMPHAGQFTK